MIESEKDGESFEIIDFDLKRYDSVWTIIPANYESQTFGYNGNQLRQIYYEEILKEY